MYNKNLHKKETKKKTIIKKKWHKLTPVGFCYKKQNNIGVFFYGNHMRHTIINWNKLWFYIQYQLNILKKILLINQNILFVTDMKKVVQAIRTTAKNLNILFIVGKWNGGVLTTRKNTDDMPDLVINFGFAFAQNFYNEMAILQIPTINFVTTTIIFKMQGLRYNIPVTNLNTPNLYFIFACTIWLVKKYQKGQFYDLYNFIDEIDFQYKMQLYLIYNKLYVYEQKTSHMWIIKNKKFINQNKQFYIKDVIAILNNIQFKIGNLGIIKKKYLPIYYVNFFVKHRKVWLQQKTCQQKTFCYTEGTRLYALFEEWKILKWLETNL